MKKIRIEHDIISSRMFRDNMRHYFEIINEENRPLVVASDGLPVAVLISPSEFDSYMNYLEEKASTKSLRKRRPKNPNTEPVRAGKK